MKITIFYDKNNFKKSELEIPKFDELDDLKVFIVEKLSVNAVIEESYQLVYENIILNDCNKSIKYIEMRDNEQIRIGHLDALLQEDDVIVELFVCEPITSLIHLILKKQDRISVLESELNKYGLNIDCIWNIKGQKMKMDQFITDNDCNYDGYIKLIIKSDDAFSECLKIHDQYLIEYYLRNYDLTYLWYRDEFNLSQTNSLRQILYQMKLALLSIDDIDSLLSKDLSIMKSLFKNSRFLFYEIMTNRIYAFCIDYYWRSIIDKFGCDEIVINVFRQYFIDALRIEIIDYTKSIRYSSTKADKSLKKIAIDALDYCLNYLIYPMKDWRYLMGLFIGEFSIGFVNDLFIDEIIDKWKDSHSEIIFNWENANSESDFQSFIDSIKYDSDRNIENKFKFEFLEMEDKDSLRILHHACCYDRVGLVKFLLSKQCNIHLSTKNGYQSIHFASLNGHIDIVKILIANKCDINASNEFGYRPIHLACKNGHIDIVKILIENECQVNVSDEFGYQPIHLSCENGHIDIVKILIANKCDINGSDECGYQPIHFACKNGYVDIVKILIAHKCDIKASDEFGSQPIQIACQNGHIDIVKLLVANKCDINAFDNFGYYLIHYACKIDNIDVVKLLIENKCDINVSDKNGNQPIHLVCAHGYVDIVKILIVYKCDINASNYNGYQPIHLACKNGHIDIVKILISKKCIINASDKNGCQPVHHALKNNHINIVQILIANKCDVNTSDDNGYRPIHLACKNGDVDIVKTLIASKCDINVSDKNGYQPIHLACIFGHIDIVNILIAIKLDINASNKNFGYQPIHYACQNGHTDIVKILITNKCDINASDKYFKWRPIQFARQYGHIEIVKILKGSLRNLIDKSKWIETAKVIKFSKQILEGLDFIHSQGIIHRDIKPDNMLLDHDDTLKLTDFGLCKSMHIESYDERTARIETFWYSTNYLAPEVLLGQRYDYPADIWSTGASIIHMITGEKP